MDIQRKLNLPELLGKKSFFLLGPRSTGKSTLIHQQLHKKAQIVDLLESDIYVRLSARPQELEDLVPAETERPIVVIDEIQKIPILLDEVHRLIEKRKVRFLLTGSSARKLKGEKTNLLAGRAWIAHLFPLSWCEIRDFDLDRYLLFGGLPQVYLGKEPAEELKAYARTYLYEEIRAEGVVRRIPPFSRFLESAALSSGQLLNFTEIASDAGVPPSTVREFYFVLEDTLMGTLLPPWTGSRKRKAIQTAKFYFFDIGVANALAKTDHLDRNSDLYGRAFEQFLGMELKACLSYTRKSDEMKFWRSVNRQEVDFVIGDHTAIEVKATRKVTPKHLTGLKDLAEEGVFKNFFLVTQDPLAARRGGVTCLPWNVFLEKLWGDDLF